MAQISVKIIDPFRCLWMQKNGIAKLEDQNEGWDNIASAIPLDMFFNKSFSNHFGSHKLKHVF